MCNGSNSQLRAPCLPLLALLPPLSLESFFRSVFSRNFPPLSVSSLSLISQPLLLLLQTFPLFAPPKGPSSNRANKFTLK